METTLEVTGESVTGAVALSEETRTMSTVPGIHAEADAPSNTALVVLDDAQTKLASITTLEDATQWRSQLVGVQHYLKSRRAGLAMQNKAALFKFQVERRIGELLLAVPKAQGKRDEADGLLLAIKRSGFTQWAAYRWMALAKLPEKELLAAAAACDNDGDELTSALVHEVIVRRWMSRHGDAASTEVQPEAVARQLTLAAAKREMEELELLEPGALVGLSDLEVWTLMSELRKAYLYYCEDEARGKVASWTGDLPHKDELQKQDAADPSTWLTDKGWYPPFTVDRGALRYLAQKIIAELRAGQGDGYRGIARQLNLANRLKGGVSAHGHNPLSRLLPFIAEIERSLFSEVENRNHHVVVAATVHLAIERLGWLHEAYEAWVPSDMKDGGRFVKRASAADPPPNTDTAAKVSEGGSY